MTTITKSTVRWPVASLAVAVLLFTLALVIFSGRNFRPSQAHDQPQVPDTPARIRHASPAVPSPDYDAARSVADAAPTREQYALRAGLPRPSPIPQRSTRPPLANKPQATVELTGVIGIPGMIKALLEITEPGFGGTVRNVTLKEGDRVDAIEVVQIDVAKGRGKIRNSGAESVLTLKTPQAGSVAANPQVGSQPASFATPPGNWPIAFGDLNGDIELRINNPNEFNVRVGLRSGRNGKDFIVPAYGTQSVQVPSGSYVTYFQYSSEPGGMYRGDNFTLHNNEITQITITKVVNGNYGIRKVN